MQSQQSVSTQPPARNIQPLHYDQQVLHNHCCCTLTNPQPDHTLSCLQPGHQTPFRCHHGHLWACCLVSCKVSLGVLWCRLPAGCGCYCLTTMLLVGMVKAPPLHLHTLLPEHDSRCVARASSQARAVAPVGPSTDANNCMCLSITP